MACRPAEAAGFLEVHLQPAVASNPPQLLGHCSNADEIIIYLRSRKDTLNGGVGKCLDRVKYCKHVTAIHHLTVGQKKEGINVRGKNNAMDGQTDGRLSWRTDGGVSVSAGGAMASPPAANSSHKAAGSHDEAQ